MSSGSPRIRNIAAVVDLASDTQPVCVENAFSLASALAAEVTLVTVVERRQFGGGRLPEWPANAFGKTRPDLEIHRVFLPGCPEEAIAVYADRIRADILLLSAEYRVRRWLRTRSLAQALAAMTSRAMWIMPRRAGIWTYSRPPRIGCLMRLDETDEQVRNTGQAFLENCGGELVLLDVARARPARFGTAEEALIRAAHEHNLGLIIARRTLYARSSDVLSVANRLPCPLLSVALSSVATNPSLTPPRVTPDARPLARDRGVTSPA